MAKTAMFWRSKSGSVRCSSTSCVLQKGHQPALRWKTINARRSPLAWWRHTLLPCWFGSVRSGKCSPTAGPMWLKSIPKSVTVTISPPDCAVAKNQLISELKCFTCILDNLQFPTDARTNGKWSAHAHFPFFCQGRFTLLSFTNTQSS